MDILKVVHEGAYLPTQIMYRANLAWVSLQGCLGSLVRSGLLERAIQGNKRTYQLTARGTTILADFGVILEAVSSPASLRAG
jgi:predicted transcriptional regulator